MPEILDLPTPSDSALAREAARRIAVELRVREDSQFTIEFDGRRNETIVLPRRAVTILMDLLGQMANGNAVTLVPVHAELTTQQAADILNVSRPFLVKLLEDGRIPHTLVGTHRRVRAQDLFAYQRRQKENSAAALAELGRLDQELGLE